MIKCQRPRPRDEDIPLLAAAFVDQHIVRNPRQPNLLVATPCGRLCVPTSSLVIFVACSFTSPIDSKSFAMAVEKLSNPRPNVNVNAIPFT